MSGTDRHRKREGIRQVCRATTPFTTAVRGLREKEEEAGGSGWDARKQKSEFLQRASITIAKGNSRVLDCMRHDWQCSTAPDLVTSTVHNPRTLAGTSDPGLHTRPNGGHFSWGGPVAL